MMYKIAKNNLTDLYKAIAGEFDLILPVSKAGKTDFALWTEEAEADLDTLKTVKSAKDAFFPQVETLYNVTRETIPTDVAAGEDAEKRAGTAVRTKLNVIPGKLKDKDFVLFGVRPCDVRAVEVMDKVFLAEPADEFYKARREHGIIASLACGMPEESCFCKTFGTDPARPENSAADIAMWLTGDELYMKPVTDKGEALVEKIKAALAGVLAEADENPAAVEEQKKTIDDITAGLPLADLTTEGWGAGKTGELFESPLWDKLYKPCLGCGTCTFVCPTCQCYDIKDYNTKDGVQRYRCWDSCMYSDFTLMAGGQNRHTQLERFRQRFMHKLVYYPTNNDGMFMCVGCGRCVDRCPQSLSIVKVMKAFREERREEDGADV